jgi:glyoxylase-like metal-dependent hydrolase (beta-lactamase superfamily II)
MEMSERERMLTRRDTLKLGGALSLAAAAGAAVPASVEAAAPMLGVQRPQVYRFKIGDFEVTNILDGFVQNPSLHPTFGSDQPADAVQALARANGIPTRFDHHYVPTLVNTGKELVLFDTGNPGGRMPTAGKLPELLPSAGYKPEQIDVVVITHGHPDHIGGLTDQGGKPTYPNARYVFGEVEFDFWR